MQTAFEPQLIHGAALRQFTRWLALAVFSVASMFGLSFLLLQDRKMVWLGLAGMSYGLAVALAYRQITQGETRRAVLVMGLGMLLTAFVSALIDPALYPLMSLVPQLVVAMALPYLSGRTLQRLIRVCWAFALLIVLIGELHETASTSFELVRSLLRAGSTLTVGSLVLLLLWQFHGRMAANMAEIQATNQVLRESEARFRRLAENAVDVIYRFSGNSWSAPEYLNRSFQSISGYTVEECYATPNLLDTIVHPDDRPLMISSRDRFFAFDRPLTVRWIRKDGRVIWLEHRMVPIFDSAGELIAVEGIGRDVTVHKQTEDTLRFLAEAGGLLADPLANPPPLARVAPLLVPVLGDWCVVDLVDGAGLLSRLAVVQAADAPAAPAEQLQVHSAADDPISLGARRVLALRRSRLVDGPELQLAADDNQTMITQLGRRELMQVPLLVGERILGVITLVAQPGRRYGPPDLALAEELAHRTALATENARLYRLVQAAFEEKAHALMLLDTLLASAPVGMAFLDRDLRFVRVNDSLVTMSGLSQANMVGRTAMEVLPQICEEILIDIQQVLASGTPIVEHELRHGSGGQRARQRYWLVSCYPVHSDDTTVSGIGMVVNDITERKNLEAQFLQSQKMESIGQLAGGVAHDFNNLLTAIVGYADLAQASLDPQHAVLPDLQSIQEAATRATTLTSQLLAFARKQVIEPRVFNINDLIFGLDQLLRRLIGESIELTVSASPESGTVRADPGRIEQVLVNLVVNARDAMPRGGRLTIETGAALLDVEYAAANVGVQPGPYVLFAVTDTGMGMDAEVREHLFEPFFTTKPEGYGTGLGLATCYGIVKQHGGHICAYSELGKGTTFKVYLPCADGTPERLQSGGEQRPARLPSGTETVLVVEDDATVRDLVARVLRGQGYTVLVAANGNDALTVSRTHGGVIDLLLTDIVMPGMDGSALVERLRPINPALKVLFASGYTPIASIRHGWLGQEVAFIQKPFSPVALARKVRAVLDDAAR